MLLKIGLLWCFNRTYRHEVLNAYVFESLSQVREITRAWITEYNEERPHDSLGKIPPAMFRRQVERASLLLNWVIDGEAYATKLSI